MPPPSSVQEGFADTMSTNTRQNVTGDPGYLQGGPAHGQVHPPQGEFHTSRPRYLCGALDFKP